LKGGGKNEIFEKAREKQKVYHYPGRRGSDYQKPEILDEKAQNHNNHEMGCPSAHQRIDFAFQIGPRRSGSYQSKKRKIEQVFRLLWRGRKK